MANTYSSLFFHLVFSTKHRLPVIKPEIEERVWQFLGGIARKHQIKAIQVGGFDDHIHALVMSPPKYAPAEVAKWIKGESSGWLRDTFPAIGWPGWQDGYGAFTVNKSLVPAVVDYIKNQREHHSRQSFEDEYIQLMKLHEIDFDPRFLFD